MLLVIALHAEGSLPHKHALYHSLLECIPSIPIVQHAVYVTMVVYVLPKQERPKTCIYLAMEPCRSAVRLLLRSLYTWHGCIKDNKDSLHNYSEGSELWNMLTATSPCWQLLHQLIAVLIIQLSDPSITSSLAQSFSVHVIHCHRAPSANVGRKVGLNGEHLRVFTGDVISSPYLSVRKLKCTSLDSWNLNW